MDVIHIMGKVDLLNTLERFYIYDLSKKKLQMNDTYTDTYNPIFSLLIKNNLHKNYPPYTPLLPPNLPTLPNLPSLPPTIPNF
jgi:hypothetical protein